MNMVTDSKVNAQNCKLKMQTATIPGQGFGLNPGEIQLPLRQIGNETNKVLQHVHMRIEKFQSNVFPPGLRIKGLSLPGTN